ncbi:MAG: Ig-like domain-containing protein [Nitrospira sp.]|nr:Ig-like domain-containing protein [Nitrospira sp.]
MLISCRVRNADTKEWISSADVTLLSQEIEEVCVQTDLNGISQMSAKAGATFLLRFEQEGFCTREVPVTTTDKDLDLGIIELKPDQVQVQFHIQDQATIPLEGAAVVCMLEGKELGRATSDAQGLATLTLSHSVTERRINYRAELTGFVKAMGNLVPSTHSTQTIQLFLQEVSLDFVIKDELGNPLKGATVTCHRDGNVLTSGTSNAQGMITLLLHSSLAQQRIHYTAQRTGFEPETGELIPSQQPALEIRLATKGLKVAFRISDERDAPLVGSVVTLRFGGDTLGMGSADQHGRAEITLDAKYAGYSVTYEAKYDGFQAATGVLQVEESNLLSIILKKVEIKKVAIQLPNHWKTWKRFLYVLVPWVMISPYLNKNLAFLNWFLVGSGALVMGGIRPITPLRSFGVVFLLQILTLIQWAILSNTRAIGVSELFIFSLLFFGNAFLVAWICRRRRRVAKTGSSA